MVSVFVVKWSDYEDSSIEGVFSTLEKAEEACALLVEKHLAAQLRMSGTVKDVVDIEPHVKTRTVDDLRARIRLDYTITEHPLDSLEGD